MLGWRGRLQRLTILVTSVADPGFPGGGGANYPGGEGCQHMILPNFPENCMKSKEFGCPGGGGGGGEARDPPINFYLGRFGVSPSLDKHFSIIASILGITNNLVRFQATSVWSDFGIGIVTLQTTGRSRHPHVK